MRDYLVTVCSACKRSCCWQGLFFCDDYLNASTEDLPASKLRELKLEHRDYFSKKFLKERTGSAPTAVEEQSDD